MSIVRLLVGPVDPQLGRGKLVTRLTAPSPAAVSVIRPEAVPEWLIRIWPL